jgi:hypothetical protein
VLNKHIENTKPQIVISFIKKMVSRPGWKLDKLWEEGNLNAKWSEWASNKYEKVMFTTI